MGTKKIALQNLTKANNVLESLKLAGITEGRPRLFEVSGIEALKTKILHFFDTETYHTITRLSSALGVDRTTFYNYCRGTTPVNRLCRWARSQVERFWEDQFFNRNVSASAPIFCLKANFGWRDGDAQQLSQSGTVINVIQFNEYCASQSEIPIINVDQSDTAAR